MSVALVFAQATSRQRVGDVVTILDTASTRDKFPEGIGRRFVMQEWIDARVCLVEGSSPEGDDVQLTEAPAYSTYVT